MITEFPPGTRVRIAIPNTADPGHDLFDGRYGTIVKHLGTATGSARRDMRGERIYRVLLDDDSVAIFAQADLQPVMPLPQGASENGR